MIAWLGPSSVKRSKHREKIAVGIDNDIIVSGVILLVRILYSQIIPLCDDEWLF